MEPAESKKTRISPWVWLLVGIGLLMLCALTVAGIITVGAISLFSTASSDGISEILQVETVVGGISAEEILQPTAENLVPSEIPTEVESRVEDGTDLPTQEAPTAGSDLVEATPIPQLANTPPLQDSNAGQRATIEANVVEIRRLTPLEDVAPTLLSTSELGHRMEQEFAEEYSPEEARNDAIALSAFDFLEPDFDLYNFTIGLLTEQVAGFYDPESDEFVVVSNDDDFSVLEQWTHAHEFVHALQDQHYDLEILDDESLDSEASFAIQALAEGDATLVQTMYLLGGYFDQDQLFEIMTEALQVDTAILESAPPIIARELEFPYIEGLAFVQALYDRGGFVAVDQAWESPPQSSEHILHPDRYLAGDAPQLVSLEPLTDTLGTGWYLADEDVLGEFYLREYLAQQLGRNDVDLAAKGWGGDRYAVYWNENNQELVMVLKLAWDSEADAQEFNNTYPTYPQQELGSSESLPVDGGMCWSGDDVICLIQEGETSLVVRAPDLSVAQRIVQQQTR